MSCNPDYANFKLVDHYSNTQLLTELENNLKHYLDWSFLSIGAWTDVTIQTPSVTDGYGGSPETLRWVDDASYTDGQVWQGFRKDWVYESGVDYISGGVTYNPLNIQSSGVSVDSTFQTGDYHINYPLGRVVFDTAISTSSTVKLNYSYRNVQTYIADSAPWWRELQLKSLRSDDIHFTQDARTGDWSIGGHHRIQLPAIIVEAVTRGRSRGYELGNQALWIEQDVLFHVLADNRIDRNKIISILQTQTDHTVWLFDSDVVTTNNAFPLDYRGERINGNVYKDLVSNSTYRWKKCKFLRNEVHELQALHPMLYEGVVRCSCEIVYGSA